MKLKRVERFFIKIYTDYDPDEMERMITKWKKGEFKNLSEATKQAEMFGAYKVILSLICDMKKELEKMLDE